MPFGGARAYVAAGADLVQPISRCFRTIGELRQLREACGKPLSLQILGWLETDLDKSEIGERRRTGGLSAGQPDECHGSHAAEFQTTGCRQVDTKPAATGYLNG